jgi:hypothetical protein
MSHRQLLQRQWAGIAALALLVLAAGACALDQDGVDEHRTLQDLCLLALLVPAVTLLVVGLHPAGSVLRQGPPALLVVPLAVPQPPPRRAGSRRS